LISCNCTDRYLVESINFIHDKVVKNPDEESINYLIGEAIRRKDPDVHTITFLLGDILSIDSQVLSDHRKLVRVIHRLVNKAKKPLLTEMKTMEKRLERTEKQKAKMEEEKAALAKENHHLTLAKGRLQSENDWMRICDKL